MKVAIIAALTLALPGCQAIEKVTIQGVDFAKERPLAVSAALIGGGVIIAHYIAQQDSSEVEKPACKTWTSVPDYKAGSSTCAIPLDVNPGN